MKLILLQLALWTLEADTTKTYYFLGGTTALANSVLGSYVHNLQGLGQKIASQIWTVATSTSFFFLLLLRTLYNQKLGLEVMGLGSHLVDIVYAAKSIVWWNLNIRLPPMNGTDIPEEGHKNK